MAKRPPVIEMAYMSQLMNNKGFGKTLQQCRTIELSIGLKNTGQYHIEIENAFVRIQFPRNIPEKNIWYRSFKHQLQVNLWLGLDDSFQHVTVKRGEGIVGTNAHRDPHRVKMLVRKDKSILLTGEFTERENYRKLWHESIPFRLVLGKPTARNVKRMRVVTRDRRNPSQSVLLEWK